MKIIKNIYFYIVIIPIDMIKCYKKQRWARKHGINITLRSSYLPLKDGFIMGQSRHIK